MSNGKITILAIIATIFLTACSQQPAATPTATATATNTPSATATPRASATPSPTASPTQDIGSMSIYQSASFPFEIQVPAGWTRQPPSPDAAAIFASEEGHYLLISETVFDITGTSDVTAEGLIDHFLMTQTVSRFSPELTDISGQELVTEQGLAAETVTLTRPEESVTISRFVFVYNGAIAFSAAYVIDEALFDDMTPLIDYSFNSFQVTEPEEEAQTAPVPADTLQAATIIINSDGSGEYPDLATAVAAAKPGAVVFLNPGSYFLDEPLDIDKAISLKGSGVDETEILIEAGDYVLRFDGDGPFVLEDLAVRFIGKTSADVVVVDGGVMAFKNCAFVGAVTIQEEDEWHAGLLLRGNTSGIVEGCFAKENNGDGIRVDAYFEIQLIDNIVMNNSGDGIYVGGAAQPTIEGNTCSGNGMSGIMFADNTHGTARENDCSKNQGGIAVTDGASPTLKGNICSNNSGPGIIVAGRAQPWLFDNIVMDNGGVGIWVGDEAQPNIEGNNCSGNGMSGILYDREAGGQAQENDVSNNSGFGFEIGGKAEPVLGQNNCSGNGDAGIGYFDQSAGLARQNTCSENLTGISVTDQAHPTLEENILSDNSDDGLGYMEEASGQAIKNQCYGNNIGISVAQNANPELINNWCFKNRETDLKDERQINE